MILAHGMEIKIQNRIPRKIKKRLKKDVIGWACRKFSVAPSVYIKLSVDVEEFNRLLKQTQELLYQFQTQHLN